MSSLTIKKSWLIYFIIISSFYPPVKTDIQTWKKHLRRYFDHEQNFYQIVIFSDKENPTSLISKELVRNIPTLWFSLETLESKTKINFVNTPSFGEPRSTTLFIKIIKFQEKTYISKMQNFANFLNELSLIRSLPKCLIIFLQKQDFNYRNLLHQLWNNRFLDITILHLQKTQDSNNALQVSHNLIATVDHYNPFTDVYFSGKLVPEFQNWFPNKVKDMNGYQIKAGLINKPPHSSVIRNSTGHPINVSGPDVLMFQAVSKTLNFTYLFPPSKMETLGVINRANKSASGFIGDLLYHRINVLVNHMVRTRPPKCQLWEYSRTVELESFRALVPILPAKTHFAQQEIYLTMIFFFFTNIFVWIVSRLLKFDPRIWQGMDIAQVLMGNSAFHVPFRTPERILFTSVLFVSFINVTVLYAGFTSFRMIFTPEVKFDSFEALDASGLTPVILKNFFSVTFDFADGAIANLGKKTIKWDSDEIGIRCPKYLHKYNNITCLLLNSEAEVAMRATEVGILAVKTMKPFFWSCGTAMGFEKGSPYVDEFNNVIMHLIEGGLRAKWTREAHKNSFRKGDEKNSVEDDEDDKYYDEEDDEDDADGENPYLTSRKKRLHIKINRILMFIVVYGGSVSFVAFIFELVFHYSKKYVGRKKRK